VITVGATNLHEQFIGYSSCGPAALDPEKPDFCSVSHFAGYRQVDTGTSAATPICAAIVALLKQSRPSLTQDEAKAALKTTAKDIGPLGFDQFSGAGIIRPKAAIDFIEIKHLG
jgi:subtilisin family serine protease